MNSGCQFLHCEYTGPIFMTFRFDNESFKTCIMHGKYIEANGHSFEFEDGIRWLFSPVFVRMGRPLDRV